MLDTQVIKAAIEALDRCIAAAERATAAMMVEREAMASRLAPNDLPARVRGGVR